ncbi:THAP domain-containing protein 3-like [Trichoplusia ni]|uniref:THAP domain-containing protein 3-like n=1 Tax=Trichoplusia ni TaxID=7111 RepID=A0A7E5X5E1_TRINI|nr:THAP domain-containing protein 3-like isoform X2 [Trichoplusia ni]XP_026747677.1 THAP domain-containing protein 3-like [Trichoplusia ni]
MPSCAVKWCGKHSKTSSYKKDGITFHRFPKIPELKEKWMNKINRENWFPTKYSAVCSRHFTPDCFEYLKQRRRLFSSAIPTMFLPILASPYSLTESNTNVPGPSHHNTGQSSTMNTKVIVDPEIGELSPRKRKMKRQIDHLIYSLNNKKKHVKRLQDKNRVLVKKMRI